MPMCAFQLIPQFVAPLERWSEPAECLAPIPTPPPCSTPPVRPEVERLRSLAGVMTASQLLTEGQSFSKIAGGIPRSGITEFCGPSGSGKTELLLQALAENPESRIAWIESPSTIHPRSFLQHGVALERVLFCNPGSELSWCAQQVLRSGIFEFVVIVPKVPLAPTVLRRIQLATEQARSSTILLSEKPTAAGAWTIRLQFQAGRHRELPRLHPLKTRPLQGSRSA